MDGLVLDATGFEVVVADQRIGPRRSLTADDVSLLDGLAERYVQALCADSDPGVFADFGRQLSAWLDGDTGRLSGLLERASSPLVFEIRGSRTPSDQAWALLRAPFELLTHPDGGFLAENKLIRFAVVRRLGAIQPPARPLDEYRLGMAFMASSPSGQHELDFEAEEAAILAAVGEARIDLVVDDTGDPVQLGHRLADLNGVPVVHLSCHGINNWNAKPGQPGVPVLLMETDLGGPRPTTAADLVTLFTVTPRLLFVSACLTATTGLAAHSLSTELVSAGVPAVIGWDGSVGDRAATVFAQRLYQALADKADLAVAVGDARRLLLESTDPAIRADWHLARLWLGPTGGGPLVAGNRKRTLVSATRGTKTFLDRKQQHVPVASAEMFVGRRAEMQQALRALRSGDRAGVLLHGQGRLGKSSLAARIADRFPDRAVAVVYGDYSALAVLDAIADAVRTNQAARDLIKKQLPLVRQDPEAIESVLIDLLTGPLAQAVDGRQPLLLVIDDLEQILIPDPSAPHRVTPEHAPVLAAIVRAFDPAETDSRLLITSRFVFTLDGCENRLAPVQLRPLSEVAQLKLLGRQQALTPPQRLAERAALVRRALAVCRGNPGLQDLIGLRLVYSEQVALPQAEAAVAGMETYLQQGDLPSDAQVREFLENLALDTLVQQAGAEHVALLRAATLFDMPVPESVIAVLAGQVGGSMARLRGLGLLDVFDDAHDPRQRAVAVNALAAGRLTPLDSGEQATLAALAVDPLHTAWGGATPPDGRDVLLDLQLTRLALLGDDPAVAAACAARAVHALRSGPAMQAFELGRQAIALLDRHQHHLPVNLLWRVADAALTSGDGQAGEALLRRAVHRVQAGDRDSTDPLDRARVLAEYAKYLIPRSEPEQAEQLLRQAEQLFTAAGSAAEAATCWGRIADIAYRRGEYDEALRIRREVELPVYERLGNTRSASITWGKIADIAYMRGDYDEALRIRREVQLPVYERLGDTRSVAVAWGQIADIAFERGDHDEALRIRREVQLPVFERLGDTREAAVAWGRIADIACRRGDYDEALRIHREVELPVYERLGDTRSAAIAWGRIADIAYMRGDYDEALRIRREAELPVYERLGDTRSVAVTWGKIAHVAYERGDYDEAAELHHKRLKVNRQLGNLDGVAAATWGLAQIDLARQDYQSATPRLAESFQLFMQLQRADGVAIVGNALGRLLLATGRVDEARQVLEASSTAAAKIGMTNVVEANRELLRQ